MSCICLCNVNHVLKRTMTQSTVVAHSLSPQGAELISILGTFPRHILAEVNTHRMLSKNTSSSRAIPFAKMVEAVETNPFIPLAWQKNHSGMQGSDYHEDERYARNTWLRARDNAVKEAKMLNINCDVTKQMANRLLEPFMWTTMLITGSREGWENFFHLRCPQYVDDLGKVYRSKKDLIFKNPQLSWAGFEDWTDKQWLEINQGQAEIHMMDLAEKIWDSINESTPKQLKPTEWHIPFKDKIDELGIRPFMKTVNIKSEEHKRHIPLYVKLSVAMAARTSYTMVGEEKNIDCDALIALHDRLLNQEPPHSSPFEHTARAMTTDEYMTFIKGQCTWNSVSEELIAPVTAEGWCYNLKGFIPYRYIVDNKLSL